MITFLGQKRVWKRMRNDFRTRNEVKRKHRYLLRCLFTPKRILKGILKEILKEKLNATPETHARSTLKGVQTVYKNKINFNIKTIKYKYNENI